MIDFKAGEKRLRTNLAVLSISGSSTLAGVLIVSYGAHRLIPDHPILTAWYWPLLVLALGVCGVLALISKGIVRPRSLRYGIGLIGLFPALIGIVASSQYAVLPLVAFTVPALACLMYAIAVDEPVPEETTRDLLRFFAAIVLIFLAPLSLVFVPATPLPVGPPVLWALSALGIVGGALHLLRPASLADRLAGLVTGAAFIAFSLACLSVLQLITAIVFLPVGTTLLFFPLFRHYRLGSPDPDSLSEENHIVRQFETLAELIAWSVFLFTYLHIYLQGSSGGISAYIFGTFTACYLAFTIQYRLWPPQLSTYRRLYIESLTNIVLLALVCHFTGGLYSPYVWFFIFTILSGSIAPEPRKILHRLYLILCFFGLEALSLLHLGLLTRIVVVQNLLRPVFIIGLIGLYAYYLSLRRRKIDGDLLKANASYKEALARETAAKELIIRQAEEIGLDRNRDEALLSSLADGVVALDPNGLIRLVNPVAETMFGYAAADVVGKRLRDMLLLKREDDPAFRLGTYIDTGLHGNAIPLPEGLYLEREDGRKVFYTGMILPVLDAQKRPNGAVAVMQDVTYLREVDQMKTSFLSVAAHQLRTPLSTIRWYLELLNDPAEGRLNKDQKTFAENAYTSLLRMVGLVNRLLAITRLEAERVPVRPQPVDLKALTREILGDAERKLREHGLEAEASVPDHLAKVPLDPTLAREVLVNLVENAIRYTPKGGSIAIEAHDAGDELVWSIKDDGIGIPKAQQAKIFEKFFRATNAVELSSEGSGLGLYLARFIVEAWGGKLSFTSEEGKGATFRVTIPKKGMKPKSGQVSLNA